MIYSILTRTFLLVYILFLFAACTPSNNVFFPYDGIYRFLILDNYNARLNEEKSGTYVSQIYIYNLDLDHESTIDTLAAFAQYYHCYKNEGHETEYQKGVIKILSDVKDYKLAPRYHDDMNSQNIESKIRFVIITKYDRVSKKISTFLRLNGREDELSYSDSLHNCLDRNLDTLFIPIEGRWWEDIQKLAQNAWDNQER